MSCFLLLKNRLLAGIIFLSLLLTASSYILLPVQAFGENKTNNIAIVANQADPQTLQLDYTVTQTFATESRGIYFSLPKNQNGVWTEYEVTSVKRSQKFDKIDQKQPIQYNLPCSQCTKLIDQQYPLLQPVFADEPYDIISEWNELRFRIGKPDRILDIGTYIYTFRVEVKASVAAKHNVVVLHDWTDPVDSVAVTDKVTKNSLCQTTYADGSCAFNNSLSIQQNTHLNTPSWWSFLVNNYSIYFIILILILTFFFILWYFFARDAKAKLDHFSPAFEPPTNIFPWQAQFLIQEGQIDLKRTLLSYIMWLNEHKYIEIQPKKEKKDEPTILIKKDLPTKNTTFLPDIFNETVKKIAEEGFKQGILSSKISPATTTAEVQKSILQSVELYYTQKPIKSPILQVIIIAGIGFVLSAIGFGVLQDTFLVGSSILALIAFAELASLPCWYFLFYFWGKMNDNGILLRDQILQYKYYIQKAEQLKLDFSNTPDNGVQYYLQAVPFAAAFGLLATFGKFMQTVMPQQSEEISTTNSVFYAMQVSHFYVPPSSSSDGGGDFSSGGFSGGGGSW